MREGFFEVEKSNIETEENRFVVDFVNFIRKFKVLPEFYHCRLEFKCSKRTAICSTLDDEEIKNMTIECYETKENLDCCGKYENCIYMIFQKNFYFVIIDNCLYYFNFSA